MGIHHWHCIEKCAVGETYLLTTKHTKIAEIQEDLKLLSLHVYTNLQLEATAVSR